MKKQMDKLTEAREQYGLRKIWTGDSKILVRDEGNPPSNCGTAFLVLYVNNGDFFCSFCFNLGYFLEAYFEVAFFCSRCIFMVSHL